MLFEGVLVSKSKVSPTFALSRKSFRVLDRVLKTGELALIITFPAWGFFGSNTGELFDHHRAIGKRPGLLPLPPGGRIDIDVMKLGKAGLGWVELIWSDWLSYPNPFPIYVRAKFN